MKLGRPAPWQQKAGRGRGGPGRPSSSGGTGHVLVGPRCVRQGGERRATAEEATGL